MIAIVDYRAGNLTSVRLALESIRVPAAVTSRPEVLAEADRVIFPGVGAAGAAMRTLAELNLVDPLREVVARGTPFLGICLGTQIISDFSEEDGGTPGVGLIPGRVQRFRPTRPTDKIPHMGWNSVTFRRPHPVLEGIEDGSEFYFVHSFYPAPADPALVVAETAYADTVFASVLGRNNLVATQFHPEKSGRIGLRLLENFCRWDGRVPDPGSAPEPAADRPEPDPGTPATC